MDKTLKFRIVDIFYLFLIIAPLVAGMVIKVLTEPAAEGIKIAGANIFFTIPFFIQDIVITESQINSWLIIITILGICLYLTHGLKTVPGLKRQHLAEMAVEKVDALVLENMGEMFMGFSPFIAGIMILSALSSLSCLVGMYSPTSDINVTAGWAILVFILITHYKLKGGFGNYLKSFAEPVVILTPMNIISEIATPVSMAFRHYGNVLSGAVISALLGSFLGGLTEKLPGILGQIPFLRAGIPAVLSLYFDIFSGCMQAFIFAMLTMLYVSGGFPGEAYEKRMKRKIERAKKRAEAKARAAADKV